MDKIELLTLIKEHIEYTDDGKRCSNCKFILWEPNAFDEPNDIPWCTVVHDLKFYVSRDGLCRRYTER